VSRVSQSVEGHVHGTIPFNMLDFLESFADVAKEMMGEESHVAWLLLSPSLTSVKLVVSVGNDNELRSSKSVVASQVLVMIRIPSSQDIGSPWEECGNMISEFREKQDHEETSGIKVSEGKLSHDKICNTESTQEFTDGPASVIVSFDGIDTPLVNSRFV